MDALPVPNLLHRIPGRLPGYLHVGTARNPIKRFISAFQEVYSRARLPDIDGVVRTKCWHRKVPWLMTASGLMVNRTTNRSQRQHASSKSRTPLGFMAKRVMEKTAGRYTAVPCAQPEKPLSPSDLRAILRQFVADLECSTRFPNVAHLYSQSLFLGGNTSVPQPVDRLLHLESLNSDLQAFKVAIGYLQRDTCPLKAERVASDKPHAVPNAETIHYMLQEDPSLLQAVCNIYMQDFVCLGYELPEGCVLEPMRDTNVQ